MVLKPEAKFEIKCFFLKRKVRKHSVIGSFKRISSYAPCANKGHGGRHQNAGTQ